MMRVQFVHTYMYTYINKHFLLQDDHISNWNWDPWLELWVIFPCPVLLSGCCCGMSMATGLWPQFQSAVVAKEPLNQYLCWSVVTVTGLVEILIAHKIPFVFVRTYDIYNHIYIFRTNQYQYIYIHTYTHIYTDYNTFRVILCCTSPH
jgi:hypothetical protein